LYCVRTYPSCPSCQVSHLFAGRILYSCPSYSRVVDLSFLHARHAPAATSGALAGDS
jgi:hypothetical protein